MLQEPRFLQHFSVLQNEIVHLSLIILELMKKNVSLPKNKRTERLWQR